MSNLESQPSRGRPLTRNRQQMLETAVHAYWQDEMAAVSVNTICELSGASKPSLYREFGSEDGLTQAVIEQYAQTFLKPVETLLASPESFTNKINALIEYASESSQMQHGCLFVKMQNAKHRLGPKTVASLEKIDKNLALCFTNFFKHSALKGEWTSTIDQNLPHGICKHNST